MAIICHHPDVTTHDPKCPQLLSFMLIKGVRSGNLPEVQTQLEIAHLELGNNNYKAVRAHCLCPHKNSRPQHCRSADVAHLHFHQILISQTRIDELPTWRYAAVKA